MGRHISFKFFQRMALNIVESVLFTTSVCPSVCGWQVVENISMVQKFAPKVFQNSSRIWYIDSEQQSLASVGISYFPKKQRCYVGSIIIFMLWYKMHHFLELINDNKNRISSLFCPRQPKTKSMGVQFCLTFMTGDASLHKSLNASSHLGLTIDVCFKLATKSIWLFKAVST